MSLARKLGGALCLLALWPTAASAATPRVVLVFIDGPVARDGRPPSPDTLLRALERRRGLALGLLGPTQGSYSPAQELLDITQGTRVSPIGYRPRDPPALALRISGRRGAIAGWPAAARRASRAPGKLAPGRLASAIPGGVAFAGVVGAPTLDAVAAADRAGRVAEVSLGPAVTVAARARALLRSKRVVVVQTGRGSAAGLRALDVLVATRARDEMVIAVQSPPDIETLQLMPVALARGGGGGGGLTSDTTRTDGVVTAIDILPTIMRHLALPVSRTVTGQPIRVEPRRSAASLERLRTRYTHVAPRRVRTLEALLGVWGLLVLVLGAISRRAGIRRGLRLGALAFLWVPSAVLIPAVIDPSGALAETAVVVAAAFLLALAVDVTFAWPRGPLVPAAVCLIAYTVDLTLGLRLVDLSLLGPNPRSGARFFGVGNELEPTLPILLFVGLAAVFSWRPTSKRMAGAFAVLGGALAIVVGSGYLGADVGGVVTVSAGTAVATLAVLPGGVTKRAAAVAAIVPIAAVALLAALDLATGASTHFSRNVLEVQGGASFWEVAGRRYGFALHTLLRGMMPFVTAAAVVAVAAAIALRARLYPRLPGRAWSAALLGGLAGGVVGALSNDSGPLLFVVAVFVLAVTTAYLHGAPLRAGDDALRRLGARGGPAERSPALALQESSPAGNRPDGGRPPATVP